MADWVRIASHTSHRESLKLMKPIGETARWLQRHIFVVSVVARATKKWAKTWESVNSDKLCAQRRLKSTCASAQSDQSLRCPFEETLHLWLCKMHPLKILIRLSECADVWIYFWRCALRENAYSNMLKISSPKNENFQIKKFWYFSYFCSKHRLWVVVRTASTRRF